MKHLITKDEKIKIEESEKIDKYLNLVRELKKHGLEKDNRD